VLSDLEVSTAKYRAREYVRYPVVDSEGDWITVSTTRPETILGDTAVAVHPSDKRFAHLVGNTCAFRMSIASGQSSPTTLLRSSSVRAQ